MAGYTSITTKIFTDCVPDFLQKFQGRQDRIGQEAYYYYYYYYYHSALTLNRSTNQSKVDESHCRPGRRFEVNVGLCVITALRNGII